MKLIKTHLAASVYWIKCRTGYPRPGSLVVRLRGRQNGAVPAREIDQYLDALEEPKRTTLARLR